MTSGEAVSMFEWSWADLAGDDAVLHHAASFADPVAAELDASGAGTTSCGRSGVLSVPGVFSRMSVPRCEACCEALGFPSGVGAPKNDDACRALIKARLVAAH